MPNVQSNITYISLLVVHSSRATLTNYNHNLVSVKDVHKKHMDSMKNILRRYRTPCPCRSCAKKRLQYRNLKSNLQQQQLQQKKLRDAERARNCYQRRKEREGDIWENTLFYVALCYMFLLFAAI